MSCTCVFRRQGGIESAAKERVLEEGGRAVIPVCLFRLGVPSLQDGEADRRDDRGADEGVRHGQREEAQLLVSARVSQVDDSLTVGPPPLFNWLEKNRDHFLSSAFALIPRPL